MRGRRRFWFLLAVLLLGLTLYGGWYGVRIFQFRSDRAEAEKALAVYDFATARVRLAACLRLWPTDRSTRLLAVQAARRDGDLAAAEELLEASQPLGVAATPERTLEWSLIQAQRGRVTEVQEFLFSCLDVHHPASEQILEALAWGCIRNYQLDRARFWVEELLAKAPNNPIGRLIRAQTAESLGRDDLALQGYRSLVADFPRYAAARSGLAAHLFRTQQYEAAAAEYAELQQQQPSQVHHTLSLARCWVRLERLEEARPLIRRLEERSPDNSDALLLCGQFALGEHRPKDAERLLLRAVLLAPNDPQVHFQLGICLQQLGQPEDARQHVERARQIEADMVRLEKVFTSTVHAPADPAPRLEAAQICLRNGQAEEGLRWLYGALEVAPACKPVHAALADYFASRGDPEQAAHHRRLSQ
jgi:tetratricopeptide (TPR) repeat protein